MIGIDYNGLIEEAFATFKPKLKDFEDEAWSLAVAAKEHAEKTLEPEEFANLVPHRFLTIAQGARMTERFIDIYADATLYDLLEKAAKPAEWGATLPSDTHYAIMARLAEDGHGTRIMRIWRHFLAQFGGTFWWWVRERDATAARIAKGAEPKLGAIALKDCELAVAENKVEMLAAIDFAAPEFARFGTERDRAWLDALRADVEAEQKTRIAAKALPDEMTDALFWQIVTQGGETTDARFETLPERLAAYNAKAIKAFAQKAVDLSAAAYRADIWALAYLLMRGASDDAFDGFRDWLILQGRDVFGAALASPDDFDVEALNETPMVPDLISVIDQAYEMRAGKPLPRLRHPKLKIDEIDEDAFPAMLPRIARLTE